MAPSRRVCHESRQHGPSSQARADGTRALAFFSESGRLLIPRTSWGQRRLLGVSLSPATIALSLPAVWLRVVASLCSGFRAGWYFRAYGRVSRKGRRKNWGLGEKEAVYCSPPSARGSQDLGNPLFLALSSNASAAERVPLGDRCGSLLSFSSLKH